MVFEHQALAPGPGTRAKPPSGGPQDESPLSGASIFKPPALLEIMNKKEFLGLTICGKKGKIIVTFSPLNSFFSLEYAP
jgi:hypothetical protein